MEGPGRSGVIRGHAVLLCKHGRPIRCEVSVTQDMVPAVLLSVGSQRFGCRAGSQDIAAPPVAKRRSWDCFDWSHSPETGQLRPLLGRLHVWRDETASTPTIPTPAVHDAVACAHDLVQCSVLSPGPGEAEQDFLRHPGTAVRGVRAADGRMALLPANPHSRGQWNFGYGGSGPGAMVGRIVRFVALIDGIGSAVVPAGWIRLRGRVRPVPDRRRRDTRDPGPSTVRPRHRDLRGARDVAVQHPQLG